MDNFKNLIQVIHWSQKCSRKWSWKEKMTRTEIFQSRSKSLNWDFLHVFVYLWFPFCNKKLLGCLKYPCQYHGSNCCHDIGYIPTDTSEIFHCAATRIHQLYWVFKQCSGKFCFSQFS